MRRTFPGSPNWFSTKFEQSKRASAVGPQDMEAGDIRDDESERSVKLDYKKEIELGRMSRDYGGEEPSPARRSSDVGYEPERYKDKEFD